jgi:multiple sugar transport system substrate-binding protein
VPQPEYLQKLTTAAAGNDLPEMTIIRASDTAEMAERNVVQSMGAEALTIAGGTALAAEFPEATWKSGEYQGERYAIPLDVHPLVLYYNKDMFQQAGITMPTDRPMTRQEFEAAAAALTKDGVTRIAVAPSIWSSRRSLNNLAARWSMPMAPRPRSTVTRVRRH